MKNVTPPNVLIGFAITLALLVANIVTAYQNISKIAETDRQKIYSTDILSVLMTISLNLKDAEIGQWESGLTNNPYYLRWERQSNVNRIETQLKLLRQIQPDGMEQRQQLVWFQSQIEQRLSKLVANIERQPLKPLTRDRQLELVRQEQQTVDEIRHIIYEFESAERMTRDRYRAESRESLASARLSFGISGFLDLLLLSILYRLVNRDLRKRQQAESTLRDYAAEFEELYHNAPCGYHSLDRVGKFVRINRTELQMLGYESAELIGQKSFADLLTPESVQTFHDNFPIVKSRGWIRDLEFQIVRKDGQILPVSATVIAINDADGNYLNSRSTLIDISERLRLRKQAKLSAEISQKIRQSLNLDQILQTAVEEVQQLLQVDRVLIFRFEADGTGTVVKEQVLTGYAVVMGNKLLDPCFDLSYHAKYEQGRIYTIADITKAGFTPCYVEFLQRFEVQASSIVPIHLRDKLWGLLIIHHCQAPRVWLPSETALLSQLANQIGIALTQAQLLEQERQQRQELTRSNAELEQFAYVASHDLQEPLRMVMSYLQLIERRYQGKLDQDADEFIGYAVDGAVRMQTLIQALLSYARVSSRAKPFTPVDCNIILQHALDNLQLAVRESGAIITSDPLPIIAGDPTQLTQLFQNLIANGIKFCRDAPPQIHVTAAPVELPSPPQSDSIQSPASNLASPPAAWQFAIADQGIGIEVQYLDRIFAIFQRLHSRSTYSGTGIGLAICKKIVERHGGQIWAKSEPGRGSVFYFIIPCVGNISSQTCP
jgi:PAS domain S-box-containing protein